MRLQSSDLDSRHPDSKRVRSRVELDADEFPVILVEPWIHRPTDFQNVHSQQISLSSLGFAPRPRHVRAMA